MRVGDDLTLTISAIFCIRNCAALVLLGGLHRMPSLCSNSAMSDCVVARISRRSACKIHKGQCLVLGAKPFDKVLKVPGAHLLGKSPR